MKQTLRGWPNGINRAGWDSIDRVRRNRVLLAMPLLWILSMAGALLGAQPSGPEKVLAISTTWSATGVKAGSNITLAIILDVQKPYHINAHVTKEPFMPTSIQLVGGPEFLLGSTAVFPKPHEIEFGIEGAKERIRVFSGRTVAYLPIAVEGSAASGKHEIKIRIGYQACDDKICLLPTEVIQSVELNVVPAAAEVQITQPELFAGLNALRDRLNVPFFGLDFEIAPSKLWLLLLIAAVGGFILNLTPCVLPLVPQLAHFCLE